MPGLNVYKSLTENMSFTHEQGSKINKTFMISLVAVIRVYLKQWFSDGEVGTSLLPGDI